MIHFCLSTSLLIDTITCRRLLPKCFVTVTLNIQERTHNTKYFTSSIQENTSHSPSDPQTAQLNYRELTACLCCVTHCICSSQVTCVCVAWGRLLVCLHVTPHTPRDHTVVQPGSSCPSVPQTHVGDVAGINCRLR